MAENLNRYNELYMLVAENLPFLKRRYPDVVEIGDQIFLCSILASVEKYGLQIIVTEQDEPDSLTCRVYSVGFSSFNPNKPLSIIKMISGNIPIVLFDGSKSSDELSEEAKEVFDRVFDIVNASLYNNS